MCNFSAQLFSSNAAYVRNILVTVFCGTNLPTRVSHGECFAIILKEWSALATWDVRCGMTKQRTICVSFHRLILGLRFREERDCVFCELLSTETVFHVKKKKKSVKCTWFQTNVGLFHF